MDLVTSATGNFWNDPVILYILDFSQWINYIVFVLSLLFLLADIAQEQAGRGVDWTHVVTSGIKAFGFVLLNRWIALLTVQLADILIKAIDFKDMSLTPEFLIENMASSLFAISARPLLSILLPIIVVIASGIFFFVVIQRFGAMLIHILTSSLYIADIVRGDGEKMGEWLRQMIAISITYVFQYLLYYLGLYLCAAGNIAPGIGCWIVTGSVGRILQRYGYSTGTKGAIGNASRMAGMGLARLIKM